MEDTGPRSSRARPDARLETRRRPWTGLRFANTVQLGRVPGERAGPEGSRGQTGRASSVSQTSRTTSVRKSSSPGRIQLLGWERIRSSDPFRLPL